MVIHHFIPSSEITIYMQEIPHLNKTNNVVLSNNDKKQLETIRNSKRKREFLTVRNLLYQAGFSDRLSYKEKKPFIKNSDHYLSISHSKTHSVIGISLNPVGIDIEIANERVRKPAKRILTKNEIKMTKNDISYLTVFWSCKEAIYKINNNLKNFTSDMIIYSHDTDKNEIKVKCSDKTRTCYYKNLNEVFITWCVDNNK